MSEPPHLRHAVSPQELQQRLEAERAGTPFLVFADEVGRQRLVTLAADRPRLTVGRASDCDVAVAWDERVSRVHAELVRTGSEWAIVDDGLSRNGTYLNGSRVAGRRRLHDGDVVAVGATSLHFRAPGDGGGSTVAASHVVARPHLSDAQQRVLQALCTPARRSGLFVTPPTNQEIATELYLTVETVKTHLRALFEKFAVEALPQNQKRVRLVERAFLSGAVKLPD